MAKSEVMDLTAACGSFPELPARQVVRDNILDTIEEIFSGDTRLIVVEGIEGIGKTTLLAQYAERHPQHALSLFLNPVSRAMHDPDLLRIDLCNQLHWLLHQEELQDVANVSAAVLQQQLLMLARRHRRTGEIFYFVVDGLHEISDGTQIQHQVLDMLPLASRGMRFLVSGEQQRFPATVLDNVVSKSFPVPRFSLHETGTMLEDLIDDRHLLDGIHRSCNGLPGAISSVRGSVPGRV